MASWKESVGRFAQNAVAKSKEMAEVTRLNLDINSQEQKIKDLYATTGEYLMEHSELVNAQDETFAASLAALNQLKDKIEQDKLALQAIRNIVVCPACGTEISRDNKFCPDCGAPVVLPVVNAEPEADAEAVQAEIEASNVCGTCGAPLESGAEFCGECGAKAVSAEADQTPAE